MKIGYQIVRVIMYCKQLNYQIKKSIWLNFSKRPRRLSFQCDVVYLSPAPNTYIGSSQLVY